MAGEKLGLPVGLNNRALCCKITGFLPIHVVVANRNTAMFDYLSLTLPTKWRAELTQTTKVGDPCCGPLPATLSHSPTHSLTHSLTHL